VIAIDKSGKIHTSWGFFSSGSNDWVMRTIKFKDINLEQITEFQFQTRPYDWIEFKNVSLKPTFKTNVQIEVEKTPANNNTATTPQLVSKLEFRIVPNIEDDRQPALSKRQFSQLCKTLEEYGPAKRPDGFAWFEIGTPQNNLLHIPSENGKVVIAPDQTQWYNRLPYHRCKDKVYILLADRPEYIMLPSQGWGLEQVHPSKDAMGRPAVQLQFDARGADLLRRLTKTNLKNALAILIDRKVVSALTIMAPVAEQALIVGTFTDQQVENMVESLRKGMPSTRQGTKKKPRRWRPPKEAQSVMSQFQQALKESNWKKALNYCSKKVRAKAAEYKSTEIFFKDILPIKEITSLPELHISGRSTRNNKLTSCTCSVKLHVPDSHYPINWPLSIRRQNTDWKVDFPTKPLNIWTKHEVLKLKVANGELKLDPEKIKDAFDLRLVPLSQNFVIGKPMLFRLEMTNTTDKTIGYTQTSWLVNDPMTIKDPNGVTAPYVDSSYQTPAAPAFAEPGQTVILADNYDVRSQYHIVKPGRYTFQFKGLSNHMKPSNIVEVDIKPGPLSPLETVVEKLIPVLPKEWKLTRKLIPLEQIAQGHAGKIIIVCLLGKHPGKTMDNAVFINIFLTSDRSEILPQNLFRDFEFWGTANWGPVSGLRKITQR